MLKRCLPVMFLTAALLGSGSYASAQQSGASTARTTAVHECSVLAARYPETTFAATEIQVYRSCMAAHGQPE